MTLNLQAGKLDDRLIVALDVAGRAEALALVDALMPVGVCHFKVGMSLFYAEGMSLLTELKARNCQVFVDLKLHDIPNTVARTVKVLIKGGATFLNVHAQGGLAMLQAARQASLEVADELGQPPATLIAVTVLTSLNEQALQNELGLAFTPEAYVLKLAQLAQAAGLNGVVCSPLEAGAIAKACGSFLRVTPGIRLSGSNVQDDQSRIATPSGALAEGSTHLVVGRPVYGAQNPASIAQQILLEMQEAQTFSAKEVLS